MKNYMEDRLKTGLPTATYGNTFFYGKVIESVTWTDFPDVVPTPTDDPASSINGDNLDYDYHFTVVVNENGTLVEIPILVTIEFD
ncbi:MAG: hypothetical protein ABS938_19675 [Psychrobacillus psychrodurans]